MDCCHSGAIIGAMNNMPSTIQAGLNGFEGTYVMTSAAEDEPSLFPTNDPYKPTYFTGKVLEIAKEGLEIDQEYCSLRDIFNEIKADFSHKGLPTPQQSNFNDADRLYFSRNKKFTSKKPPEEIAWEEVIIKNNKWEYSDFIRKYPESIFVAEALREIGKIEDMNNWSLATKENTLFSFQNYLFKHPKGKYVTEANRKIDEIRDTEKDKISHIPQVTNHSEIKKIKSHIKGSVLLIGILSICALSVFLFYFLSSKQPLKGIEPEMVQIKGGTFNMGSLEERESPIHSVTVSDFSMGKYEITVAQFYQFITASKYTTDAESDGDSSIIYAIGQTIKRAGVDWRYDPRGKRYENPSETNFPVVHVSWNDATAYCRWLRGQTGKNYRLPTEAEWEYAAGNGSEHTRYSWGMDDPKGDQKLGNLKDNGSGWTDGFPGYSDGFQFLAPVGSFKPNKFGLYDMTGNAWEWCSDWFEKYNDLPQKDPQGPSILQGGKIYRGGGWDGIPYWSLTDRRGIAPPGYNEGTIGFRIALAR